MRVDYLLFLLRCCGAKKACIYRLASQERGAKKSKRLLAELLRIFCSAKKIRRRWQAGVCLPRRRRSFYIGLRPAFFFSFASRRLFIAFGLLAALLAPQEGEASVAKTPKALRSAAA
jgi:hypothetical protein